MDGMGGFRLLRGGGGIRGSGGFLIVRRFRYMGYGTLFCPHRLGDGGEWCGVFTLWPFGRGRRRLIRKSVPGHGSLGLEILYMQGQSPLARLQR